MTISSDVAVRYQGRTLYHGVRTDGHPANVLAHLCSTLAAAGTDVLCQALAQTQPLDQAGREPLNRHSIGEVYLAACQARNTPPFLLDYTLDRPFWGVDAGHGGVLAWLGPKASWDPTLCDRIEDADVIVDLDAGRLVVPAWPVLTGQSYDAGNLEASWELDLKRLEGLNPVAIFTSFQQEPWERTLPAPQRQAALEAALLSAQALGPMADPYRLGLQFKVVSPTEAEPSIHWLHGGEPHMIFIQATADTLRGLSDRFPWLGERAALVFVQQPNGERTLALDLRGPGFFETFPFVANLFQGLSTLTGMAYQRMGRRQHVIHSSEGFGTQPGPGEGWDQGLLPDPAPTFLLTFERDSALTLLLQQTDRVNPEALLGELNVSILSFNSSRWEELSQAGVSNTPETLTWVAGMAVELARLYEAALPGYGQEMWARLSDAQRQIIEQALSPLGHHRLVPLQGSVAARRH